MPASPYLPGGSIPRPRLPEGDYRYGLDLFNAGCYWEAHEVWEAIWQAGPKSDPHRVALRGLIQAAAAYLKLGQGRTRGWERLRSRALQTLDRSGLASLWGVALDGLRDSLSRPELRPRERVALWLAG